MGGAVPSINAQQFLKGAPFSYIALEKDSGSIQARSS